MKHDYAHVLPKNLNEPWVKGHAVVVLYGKNKNISYGPDGKALPEEEKMVYMPYAVKTPGDLEHVDLVRKRKGYGVAGVEFLDNIKRAEDRGAIRAQLDLITKSPELELELKAKNEQLEAKDARIAELEAKLAAVDAPKTAKAPKSDKPEGAAA